MPTLQDRAAVEATASLAETWELVEIQPYGITEEGIPLALFVYAERLSFFDELAPVATRAGPEVHTRVLCIVQPVLGLEVLKYEELHDRQPELFKKYVGLSNTELFDAYHDLGPGNAKWVVGRLMEIRRFEERNGITTDAYYNWQERKERAAKDAREKHQEYIDDLFYDVLVEDGKFSNMDMFRYWALTQSNGFGLISIAEAWDGHDLYANDLSTGERWKRGAVGSVELGMTAWGAQQTTFMVGSLSKATFSKASKGFNAFPSSGSGGSGFTVNPVEWYKTQQIVKRARSKGLRVERPLGGMNAGLVDGKPVIQISTFATKTVATEEYLHGRFLQMIGPQKGMQIYYDDVFRLSHEVRLKKLMLQSSKNGVLGGGSTMLDDLFLINTRMGYEVDLMTILGKMPQ